MNKLEEIVYHALYKNPTAKIFVRNLYQGLYDLLPTPMQQVPEHTSIAKGTYFGFHDVSQISVDDKKLLALRNPFDGRMPNAGESEDVGYWDLSIDGLVGEFHVVDKTYAWNYHKGCREQWYDNDHIVFNTAIDGKIVAKKINVFTGESEVWALPIDSISYDRKEYLTFSYERLEHCMPGYGYPYHDESFLNDDAPSDTGLFMVDIATGVKTLLVSLAELASTAPEEFRQNHIHYVTHTEFSHDDRYISFLHRWIRKEGTNLKRWTRIMVYDRQTKTLTELPTQISGSHYVWNKRHQLLATCIINNKSVQVLFDMNDVNKYKIIAPEVLNTDGHQSFIDNDTFITDTYADKRRMAKLYKVHIPTQTVELLANLHSPKEFQSFRKKGTGHIACDFHPRVSYSCKYVTIDCASTGVRSIMVIKL